MEELFPAGEGLVERGLALVEAGEEVGGGGGVGAFYGSGELLEGCCQAAEGGGVDGGFTEEVFFGGGWWGAGDRVEFLGEGFDFGGDGAGGLALESGQLFADGVHPGSGGGDSDSFGLDLFGQVELLREVGVGGFDSGVLLDD